MPEVSKEAVENIRLNQNHIHEFIEQSIEFVSESQILRTDVQKAYSDWCNNLEIKPMSIRKLYSTVRGYSANGVSEKKSGQQRYFDGIRLR